MLKKRVFGNIVYFLTFFYNIFILTNFVGDEDAENRKKSKLKKHIQTMKKKLLLYGFCLLNSLSTLAQVPTYFNNNTAVGANAFPWGNPNRKIQWRILANSLGSVSGGNNISVVYFQTGTTASNTYPLLTIGLKQGVTQFAGGGTWETGFTNVYTGNNVTVNSTAGGWLSFTLQTPFLYDPTQVLLIDVEQNQSSTNTMTQYQASPAGPGAGRQYGNINTASPVGTDATVANFGIDVVPAVPCSTQPSTNSIVGPTAAICPNGTANMNVTNTYTAASGGIVYQWQSSTTSSVGPFTAVTGATNTAFSAPNITTATWYNVLITCTNVPGTTTSTPFGVVVSPVITSNAPYYESFEGIGTQNQLPNCSWAVSNAPNCLTYVSSNTLGRTPRTGSKFASFYYNPGGTRYYYTNGINLNAGITYSASMWYQTEYYGYNNWTDLSILYGTTQTPTGLVPIVSTNGPAVSNVYKSLSDTFSVPSTGLYYVAVRGTGNTGSSAQYLSWDDLSINIPCGQGSPNRPIVSLSANVTTICAGDPVVLTSAGADTFTWSTGSNSSVITEMPTSDITYYVKGTNTLTGCTDSVAQYIKVNASPAAIVVANKPTVCSGSQSHITAMGGVTYTWSTGSMAAVIVVSPTVPSTYTCLVGGANGCVTSVVASVSVFPLPSNVAATSSMPNQMCKNEIVTLTATGALSYNWYSSSSSIVYQGANINVSPNVTTTYTLIGTDANGCSNSSTLVQNVSDCVGIISLANSATGIRLYPNPTKSEFTIETNSSDLKVIDIVDLTGKIIYSNTSSKETVQVSLNTFAAGIYSIKIQSESSTEVIKLIKE